MLRKFRRFLREYHFAGLLAAMLGLHIGLWLGGLREASDLVAGTVALAGLAPMAWHVYQDLRIRRFDPDTLTVIAVLTALVIREFQIGLLLIVAAVIRRLLTDVAEAYAGKNLASLQDEIPKTARLLRGRKQIEVAIEAVHPGHRLFVESGEIVPVDGVDTHRNRLASGTRASEAIVLRATSDAQHSRLQRRIKLVNSALRSRAPFARQTERFVLLLMALSVLMASAVWFVSEDSHRFLAVLTVAVPSFLAPSAQLAFTTGLGRAVRRGIFARSGAALERLALARTFLLGSPARLALSGAAVEKLDAQAALGEKIHRIEAAAPKPVAFVASQESDEPALTAADVGLALGDIGSGAVSADIMIPQKENKLVRTAVITARRTLARARWLVGAGVLLSLILQTLYATGKFSPLLGIGLQLLAHAVLVGFAVRTRHEA